MADKHHDVAAFERAATLAWTQAQVQLHHLGITPDEPICFSASPIVSCMQIQRCGHRPKFSNANDLGPSGLWAHGISGDLPIVLCRIDDGSHLETVRQLVRAHRYWRMKQLAVDLVIVNERGTSYVQDLHSALEAMVRANMPRSSSEKDSGPGCGIPASRRFIVAGGTKTCLQGCSACGDRQPARQSCRAGQALAGNCARGRAAASQVAKH